MQALTFLDLPNVGRVATSCRQLRVAAGDPEVWHRCSLPSSALVDALPVLAPRRVTSLCVTNPQRPGFPGLRHSRFCRLDLGTPHRRRSAGAAAAPAPLTARCGGLVDAGVGAIIAACGPSLMSLKLPGMSHITADAALAALRGCARLETLVLRGCCGVGGGLAARAKDLELEREALEVLELEAPDEEQLPPPSPSASPARGRGRPAELRLPLPLPSLARLRHADLSHADLVDADLIALLTHMPRLESLELNFNAALTDATLDALPPSLRRLDVLGCPRLSYARDLAETSRPWDVRPRRVPPSSQLSLHSTPLRAGMRGCTASPTGSAEPT